MQVAPQITFRGLDPTSRIEEALRKRLERLERFHGRITSCHVIVEAPHHRGNKGQIYHVHVDIKVPGGDIFVGREPEENRAHEDVLIAIRDSFNAAERRLEDMVRKRSGHLVKPVPMKLQGKVVRLVPEEGFGFIGAADGREFFFRRESLVSDDLWSGIEVGSQVRFTEHTGEKGPYASAVAPV